MNLRAKKQLAAKALNVGKQRIIFVNERIDEIKEAITKQDMRDLFNEKAIKIKEISGRRTKVKKHKKRSAGNIRKNVNNRKRDYITITRKLRKHLHDLKSNGALSQKEVKELRKKIRNKNFKSKAHMIEQIGQMSKGTIVKQKSKTSKEHKKKGNKK